MLQAQQGAQHIGIEGRGVALGGLVDDRSRLSLGAGIVDGRIETAETGYGLVDQVADFIVVTDVGLDECDFGAELPEFGFECLALGLTAPGNDQAGTVPGKGQGGGATDAGQGAGDENDGVAHDSCP